MGDGEQAAWCTGNPAVHLDLAVSVGPVPDQASADEGGRAADQINEGNVRLGDADIVHRIDGDVGMTVKPEKTISAERRAVRAGGWRRRGH